MSMSLHSHLHTNFYFIQQLGNTVFCIQSVLRLLFFPLQKPQGPKGTAQLQIDLHSQLIFICQFK